MSKGAAYFWWASGSCAGVVSGVYGSLFGWVLSRTLLVASDSGSLAGDWSVGLRG